jgi:hypothetical protein
MAPEMVVRFLTFVVHFDFWIHNGIVFIALLLLWLAAVVVEVVGMDFVKVLLEAGREGRYFKRNFRVALVWSNSGRFLKFFQWNLNLLELFRNFLKLVLKI